MLITTMVAAQNKTLVKLSVLARQNLYLLHVVILVHVQTACMGLVVLSVMVRASHTYVSLGNAIPH